MALARVEQARETARIIYNQEKQRLQEIQNRITNLQRAGFDTRMLERELNKVKARVERLGQVL